MHDQDDKTTRHDLMSFCFEKITVKSVLFAKPVAEKRRVNQIFDLSQKSEFFPIVSTLVSR